MLSRQKANSEGMHTVLLHVDTLLKMQASYICLQFSVLGPDFVKSSYSHGASFW
jgi:hypothetical protein